MTLIHHTLQPDTQPDKQADKQADKQPDKQALRKLRLQSTKQFYLKIITISIAIFAILTALLLEKSHITQLKCLHPDLERFFNADCCMKWKDRLSMRSNGRLMDEVEIRMVGQSLVKFILEREFYNSLRDDDSSRLPIQVFYGPSGTGKRLLVNILKNQLVGREEGGSNLVDIDLDRDSEVTNSFLGITELLTCPYKIVTISNGQSLTFNHVKQLKNYPNSTLILLYEENSDSIQNLLKTSAASLFVDQSEKNIKSQLDVLTKYIRGRLYENENSPFYRDPSDIFENIRIFPFLPIVKSDFMRILKMKNMEFDGGYLDEFDESFAKFNVLNEIVKT